MNVSLTEELERKVDERVRSGAPLQKPAEGCNEGRPDAGRGGGCRRSSGGISPAR